MGEAAVNAAKALNYDNAGTVEFIYVGNGEFYFWKLTQGFKWSTQLQK